MKARFWTEVALGGTSLVLAVASLIRPDWIELVFGVEPDGGSGEAEWLITVLFLFAAIVSFALARVEWRRARAAETASGG